MRHSLTQKSWLNTFSALAAKNGRLTLLGFSIDHYNAFTQNYKIQLQNVKAQDGKLTITLYTNRMFYNSDMIKMYTIYTLTYTCVHYTKTNIKDHFNRL